MNAVQGIRLDPPAPATCHPFECDLFTPNPLFARPTEASHSGKWGVPTKTFGHRLASVAFDRA